MVGALLLGCSLEPSDSKHDADKEFAKLDAPDVLTVEASMERAALTALKAGEYTNSASLYQQLFDKNQQEMRYQLGLAESLRRLGSFEASIGFYDMILAKDANHIDAFEGKALALMGEGEIEDSSKMLQRIIERDPARWRTHNALGIMFAIKGMLPEAMAYFNEALKYSDKNPSIHNNVGLVLAMQQQYRQSVDAMVKGARKAEATQRKQIELNLALIHGIFGNMAEAKRVASKHLSGMSLENNLGLYAHLANDDELAKSYLNMALTGSSVYYERAWKNLDIIANDDKPQKIMSPMQKSIRVGTETTVHPMESQELVAPATVPAAPAPAQ